MPAKMWSLRRYKEGDEKDILELLRMNHVYRTIEEWSWEYKNNPFGNLIVVAEHDGRVVGHEALVPAYMKIGTRVARGSQAVDLIVHPKLRRQGISLAIGKMLVREAEKEGIDLSYGFPNKLSHYGHLKFGWFDVAKVSQLVKPLNMNNIPNLLARYQTVKVLGKHRTTRTASRYLLQTILKAISFFSKTFNQINGNDDDESENMQVRTVESFDKRIDDFWKNISKNYSVIVIRDKEYLNWRYFQKPNAGYTVLLAEKDAEILGYVVLRCMNKEGLKLGYIVDLLASPANRGLIQRLIVSAIRHFRNEKADLVACRILKNSLGGRLQNKLLKYNGFIQFSSDPLICRTNSDQLSRKIVADPEKWYITIGDTDYL
jgi:GNAT superfamily N-acetyltransferase